MVQSTSDPAQLRDTNAPRTLKTMAASAAPTPVPPVVQSDMELSSSELSSPSSSLSDLELDLSSFRLRQTLPHLDSFNLSTPPAARRRLDAPSGRKPGRIPASRAAGSAVPDHSSQPVTKPRRAKPKAKCQSRWTAETLLSDRKSPLAKADLRAVLTHKRAWEVLTHDEKGAVMALLPADHELVDAGTEQARPNFAALLNDNSFRHDCARYTRDLAEGRYEPEWLDQAWQAHARRRAGDFDLYLERKFVAEWGIEIPPAMRTQRREEPSEERPSEIPAPK